VSIHDGVGVAARSGWGTGAGVPIDLLRPTTKVCPHVVH
jgi:hypothetical protein